MTKSEEEIKVFKSVREITADLANHDPEWLRVFGNLLDIAKDCTPEQILQAAAFLNSKKEG